jgi:hypothetical protein
MVKFHCVRCEFELRPDRIPNGQNDLERTTCINCYCKIVLYGDTQKHYSPIISGWRIDFVRYSVWSLEYWKENRRKICVVPIENRTMWMDALMPTNAIELPYIDPKDLTEKKIEAWILLR